MKPVSLALYDAFSESLFGGSQAALVLDAGEIDSATRQRIARELGMPATAFVDAIDTDRVEVQFFSTVTELPMCGHGTICLFTHLLETGLLPLEAPREIELCLPGCSATVSLSRRDDGRYRVMLDIATPEFEPAPPHTGELLTLLGLKNHDLATDLPLEISRGDFVHLVLPLEGLAAMRAIAPDFNAMVAFCHTHGVDTIAAFCLETEQADSRLHVRDFCPAVGVAESAGAGTTNAALSCYLQRHALVTSNDNCIEVIAEQGIELQRPSSIQSEISLNGDGSISRLQVGGIATRVLHGQLNI